MCYMKWDISESHNYLLSNFFSNNTILIFVNALFKCKFIQKSVYIGTVWKL